MQNARLLELDNAESNTFFGCPFFHETETDIDRDALICGNSDEGSAPKVRPDRSTEALGGETRVLVDELQVIERERDVAECAISSGLFRLPAVCLALDFKKRPLAIYVMTDAHFVTRPSASNVFMKSIQCGRVEVASLVPRPTGVPRR